MMMFLWVYVYSSLSGSTNPRHCDLCHVTEAVCRMANETGPFLFSCANELIQLRTNPSVVKAMCCLLSTSSITILSTPQLHPKPSHKAATASCIRRDALAGKGPRVNATLVFMEQLRAQALGSTVSATCCVLSALDQPAPRPAVP